MSAAKELTVAAAVENIGAVTDFVNEQLEQCACPLKAQTQIDVAIDEIFSNIAYYAYAPSAGDVTVRAECGEARPQFTLTFTDSGRPFDPLQKPDPDVAASAEERSVGGLGIYIVKKSMDEVNYARADGKNILTLKKGW